MPALTLSQHRTEALALAGDPSQDIFSDNTRLNRLVNEAKDEVVGLIQMADQNYFVTTSTVAVVANTQEYALPSDMKYLRRATRPIAGSASSTYPLRKIAYNEIELYGNLSGLINQQSEIVAYYLRGANVGMVPLPNAAVTVTLWYERRLVDVTADGTTFVDMPAEWESLMDYKVAVRLKLEANEPVRDLQGREAQLQDRLIREIRRRARTHPRHVNLGESAEVIGY